MPKSFNFNNPPFDCLNPHERDRVRDALDVVFYPVGTEVLAAGSSPESLFIVMKGIVHEQDGDELIAAYSVDDCFDGKGLVAGQVRHRFIVQEEALCYRLPKAIVMQLISENVNFGAFLFEDISRKLSALATRGSQHELQSLMTAKVGQVYLRPAVFLTAEDSVFDAVAQMKRAKTSSILVRHHEQVGIFTTNDVREVVLNDLSPRQTKLGQVANFRLIAVQTEDFLFNALLLMTKHNIHRLLVKNGDTLIGMLEQLDLLSFFSNHSHLIAVQIEQAETIPALAQVSENLNRLIQVLHTNGVKVSFIAQLMQELNGQLFAKLWQCIAPPEVVTNSCLIVMGSEGRGEQILKTDQDNALIIRDGFSYDEWPALCEQFNQALQQFGYPLCSGQVMINNPIWRQNSSDFSAMIRQWVLMPDQDSPMNLAIFYDAHPVAGDFELLAEAKQYLFNLLSDNAPFYSRFARAIDAFDTPLNWFSNLVVGKEGEHKNELDLKKGGIFPIVHGVRSLALEAGLAMTNTSARIEELTRLGLLEHKMAQDLQESLLVLQGLKLRQGLEKINLNRDPDNFIRPDNLTSLDRDLLKDSLAVVKQFKTLLRHHFKLQGF